LLGLDDRGHAVQQLLCNSGQAAQWTITPVAISEGRQKRRNFALLISISSSRFHLGAK
jgi:hypothetical protein